MRPCLFLLRLCDLQSPAMDKLFYYVRKMDGIVASLKRTLNELEERFQNNIGNDYHSKMINYFVYGQEKSSLTNGVLQNEDDDDNDDDISLESADLEDDMTSDDELETNENQEDNEHRCGSKLEFAWNKRSNALRTDIAISGWMCSPHPDVMHDCITNHKGEHRAAVTRLLQQWFSHKVSTFST